MRNMNDLITIHTNNHDAAGSSATIVVSLETWENLKKINEIADRFMLVGEVDSEEVRLYKELIKKLRETGLNKWDLRTQWQATAYERSIKLEKLLN